MAGHPALVAPIKSIAAFSGWSTPEADTDYSWFNAPLEIDGVVEPGLVLHGGCYADQPDRHVSLELRITRLPGRRQRPLERIDWRSLNGGHTNQRRSNCPKGFAGKRVSNSHVHAFEMNWDPEAERMKDDDLPYADDIAEELESFEQLLRYAAKRFRINNINLVLTPPWAHTLRLGDRA